MTVKTHVINMFGAGIRYWICRIPDREFVEIEEFRRSRNLSYEGVFFDLHILERFGYKDWESIHVLMEGKGWLTETGNRMEFKSGRKKRRIEMTDFLGEGLMFDFYQKEPDSSSLQPEQGYTDVALIQREVGQIFKFELKDDLPEWNKLEFKMNYRPVTEQTGLQWVSGISYKGIPLVSRSEDSLVRNSSVLILNKQDEEREY